MIEATAAVSTANADHYVMSVCKRWPDGMDVNFHERQGVIHFKNAVATLTPRSDRLIVTILANDEPTIERLQNVVARHLDGVGLRKEPLKFDWRRSANFEMQAL